MVVDGLTEFVGNDAARTRAGVLTAAAKPRRGLMKLQWRDVVELRIEPVARSRATADVYLALTGNGLTTRVGRGENRGRTLRHDGVVHVWKRAGVWRADQPFTANTGGFDHGGQRRLTVIAVARDRESGRMLAAARNNRSAGEAL
jgi:hypothetical protein